MNFPLHPLQAPTDRPAFVPPPPPGRLRAISLAVLAHLALGGLLYFGTNWRLSSELPAFEAEVWSRVPQEAAPPAAHQPVETAEQEQPEHVPEATPPPPPPPPPPPAPAPAPPPPTPSPAPAPDIALQREKEKKAEEQKQARLQAERERRQQELQEQQAAEKRAQQQAKAQAEAQAAAEAKAKAAAEEKRKQAAAEEEQRKKQAAEEEQRKQALAEKAKAEKQAKARAAQLEKDRQANLARMAALAGASGGSGSPNSSGTAAQSSGPSSSYGGKVVARIRPNILYPDTIVGNPRAEVEVRTSPDGSIIGKRLVRSSGNPAWDDAVLRAIDRTQSLPRDEGRPPPASLVIGFRPND
jgi:colicin import membrane protein